jgi:hypothetical protein
MTANERHYAEEQRGNYKCNCALRNVPYKVAIALSVVFTITSPLKDIVNCIYNKITTS